MKRLTSTLFVAAVVLVVAGCVASLRTEPTTTPTGFREGLTYYLPKTMVQITATYRVVDQTTYAADNAGKPTGKPIGDAERVVEADCVDIKLIGVPDGALRFEVDTSNLGTCFAAVNDATITMDESGLLTGVKVPFEDKTAEIIQSVLKIGVSVAKFAAVAGERVVVRDVVVEVPVVKLIDPDAFDDVRVPGGSFCYTYSDPLPKTIVEKGPRKTSPVLTLELWSQVSLKLSASADIAPLKDVMNHFADGVYVRVPTPVTLKVFVSGDQRGAASSSVAQGGGFRFIPIHSRAFTSETTGIVVSRVTGGITEYKYTASASGAAASASAADAASQVQGLRGDLLDARKDLATKEKQLMDAQSELEKAKK